jgi:hypothetical protein
MDRIGTPVTLPKAYSKAAQRASEVDTRSTTPAPGASFLDPNQCAYKAA